MTVSARKIKIGFSEEFVNTLSPLKVFKFRSTKRQLVYLPKISFDLKARIIGFYDKLVILRLTWVQYLSNVRKLRDPRMHFDKHKIEIKLRASCLNIEKFFLLNC